jgi:response regulator RpfG family c-di-GMP phosphodiesterase
VFNDDHYVLYVSDGRSPESLVYVGESWNLGELDHRLLEVFCTNVTIAYENVHLSDELFDSQLEMIHLLAGAAETRSYETANHVRRVGLIAELLGQLYGMDDRTTEALRLAAPMHDIGKIGIPDSILNKPGPHTEEETRIMRTHAELGARLLSHSKRPLLKLASEIAISHHENWDGTGYPNGLRGEAIPIGGRITMLADVYDALGSKRCYKEPWPLDEIRAFIVEQNGKKFEPRLVELLFEHWDRVQAVRAQLPD